MASRAQPVKLGPFIGGINNTSDPTAIQDNEVVECVNFEVDLDGSLVSRPPITESAGHSDWSERIVLVGRGIFSGGTYLIGSNTNGTYYFNGTSWTIIRAGLISRSAVQFRDFVWIVPAPGSPQSGGYWSPTGGFVTDGNMPQGEASVFHKGRMWIVPGFGATVNSSRLRWTDPITAFPFTWDSNNTADVAPGDGQKLVDICVYDDNLLLFKGDSTYVYVFETNPATGVIRVVNPIIGASGRLCTALFEDAVYVFHEGNVYGISNYAFVKMNEKVKFLYDATTPSPRSENAFICVVGDRLVVRYFNRVYVLNLKLNVWSRWDAMSSSIRNFGPFMEMPRMGISGEFLEYYAGSNLLSNESVFHINDGFNFLDQEEDIKCLLRTKHYDFEDSHHFKKMAWWGADVLTTRTAIGRANPIVSNFQVKWGELDDVMWGELDDRLWDNPLPAPDPVTSTIPDINSTNRKFLRLFRVLRFRQIYYEMELVSNGTLDQGPCRLFSLLAMMTIKQTVPRQVN